MHKVIKLFCIAIAPNLHIIPQTKNPTNVGLYDYSGMSLPQGGLQFIAPPPL